MDKKVVLITGGTRGIGMNFCNYFLSHNCKVVFTGTSEASVNKATSYYKENFDQSLFQGLIVDVRNPDQINRMIEAALDTFKKIDITICNAGVDIKHRVFHELAIEEMHKAIDINLKGAMNTSHAVLKYYQDVNSGALYFMEGFGSDGRKQADMTSYGTSKYAIRYLANSLANEYKDTGIIVGNLSPGMVSTPLLTDSLYDLGIEKRKRTIRIYNILADHPKTVVDFLGHGILNNQKNGAKIYWLTGPKIALRFLTAKFKKRHIINEKDFL